ncbi:unnamed protein product [Cladocopium goreaui]|uniref:E3 ubiquitin-protein ligase HACE1 n=1 Tax=Cladocopium goreaui TaxID=2562237 RepID=A0A9P1GN70_9DINO|nr:unnamed protein product [Cladocopium goreaui]|mmetsp:Transcript_31979/g.68957  ORF Transcript_31979/g.68957 Transcript_31979/m.68957 type:complete len:207 (+) Transcript_31979:40-660(+)
MAMRLLGASALLAAVQAVQAVQLNEVQGPVLASLERDHCARLLEETYGALQGWEPRVGLFQHVCLGMAKKLELGEMNQTCAGFATAALQARHRGLPPLPELEDLWCRAPPPAPTAAPPKRWEPFLSQLRNATHGASERFRLWWSGRVQQKEHMSLIQVVPGSHLLVAADFAQRRKHELLSAAKRTLEFFCDDACGFVEQKKLRMVT